MPNEKNIAEIKFILCADDFLNSCQIITENLFIIQKIFNNCCQIGKRNIEGINFIVCADDFLNSCQIITEKHYSVF